MEAPSGFEPLHKGFADLSLSHLGTAPHYNDTRSFVYIFFVIFKGLPRCSRDCGDTKAKIPAILERIFLGGFLGVLRVLAVNADLQRGRERGRSFLSWSRLRCSVLLSRKSFAACKGFFF